MVKTSEKSRHYTELTTAFVQEWVSSHLTGEPDLPEIAREADRLASMITGDARSHGISGADIFRAIGNIDDYLISELEKRQRTPGISSG